MTEEIKKAIPGLLITIFFSLLSVMIVFGDYRTKVDAHEQRLSKVVYQGEFKAIIEGQEKLSNEFKNRMDRLENKVDRLSEQKGN